MGFYVYILHSSTIDIFYKGFTENPEKRLWEHNNGLSRYTKGKGPWDMVYLEELPDKRSALIREKSLKHAKVSYIEWLIKQPSNLIC
jgi:putative endonuclease